MTSVALEGVIIIVAKASDYPLLMSIKTQEGMGYRQLKKTEKLTALGSVARRVSELAECPVMIVH